VRQRSFAIEELVGCSLTEWKNGTGSSTIACRRNSGRKSATAPEYAHTITGSVAPNLANARTRSRFGRRKAKHIGTTSGVDRIIRNCDRRNSGMGFVERNDNCTSTRRPKPDPGVDAPARRRAANNAGYRDCEATRQFDAT
jgi:hypothetical protein